MKKSKPEKIGEVAVRLTYNTTTIAWSGLKKGTSLAYNNRKKIGGTLVGLASGCGKVISGLSGHTLTKKTFEVEIEKIRQQSIKYAMLKTRSDERLKYVASDKKLLLDTLVVGGATLSSHLIKAEIPPNIQQAYEGAYPNLAAQKSFAERVSELETEESIAGFLAGVKGKLFEMEYVKYLNDGVLADGYKAGLAESPNNPGWDIKIQGPDEETVKLIQLKATDSLSHVTEALEKYPHIDVVTTSEVFSNLVMQGMSESGNISGSPFTSSGLSETIDSAVIDVNSTMDWTPSVIAFALIAFSAYNEKGLSDYKKSKNFGERSVKAYLCIILGGAASVATNTWIGLLAGMGSRLLIGSGQKKRERLRGLVNLRKTNDTVLELFGRQYGIKTCNP